MFVHPVLETWASGFVDSGVVGVDYSYFKWSDIYKNCEPTDAETQKEQYFEVTPACRESVRGVKGVASCIDGVGLRHWMLPGIPAQNMLTAA